MRVLYERVQDQGRYPTLRGGSWFSAPLNCLAISRNLITPYLRSRGLLGLRPRIRIRGLE